MIDALVSSLTIIALLVMCGYAGWAFERALSRPAEHEETPKITV